MVIDCNLCSRTICGHMAPPALGPVVFTRGNASGFVLSDSTERMGFSIATKVITDGSKARAFGWAPPHGIERALSQIAGSLKEIWA